MCIRTASLRRFNEHLHYIFSKSNNKFPCKKYPCKLYFSLYKEGFWRMFCMDSGDVRPIFFYGTAHVFLIVLKNPVKSWFIDWWRIRTDWTDVQADVSLVWPCLWQICRCTSDLVRDWLNDVYSVWWHLARKESNECCIIWLYANRKKKDTLSLVNNSVSGTQD